MNFVYNAQMKYASLSCNLEEHSPPAKPVREARRTGYLNEEAFRKKGQRLLVEDEDATSNS